MGGWDVAQAVRHAAPQHEMDADQRHCGAATGSKYRWLMRGTTGCAREDIAVLVRVDVLTGDVPAKVREKAPISLKLHEALTKR